MDLAVVVADDMMRATIDGLLPRHESLMIRPIQWQTFVHVNRDPGCVRTAHELLRPVIGEFGYALVVFDHHGCGCNMKTPDEIRDQVRELLARNGWRDRAEVVVISPELEVWAWTRSIKAAKCMGWNGSMKSLRKWLEVRGCWPTESPKPLDPKVALHLVLKAHKIPKSSAIYSKIASLVSLRGHEEPAFCSLTEALQRWFPPS